MRFEVNHTVSSAVIHSKILSVTRMLVPDVEPRSQNERMAEGQGRRLDDQRPGLKDSP